MVDWYHVLPLKLLVHHPWLEKGYTILVKSSLNQLIFQEGSQLWFTIDFISQIVSYISETYHKEWIV